MCGRDTAPAPWGTPGRRPEVARGWGVEEGPFAGVGLPLGGQRVGNWVDGVSVQHREGAECPVVGSMLCAFHHNGETGGVGLRAGAVLCVLLNRQLA